MSIGAGIFLMMVGAIFTFGIRDRGGAVNLHVVGVIVMLAGAAGIWLSYRITSKRQRAVPTPAIDPVAEEQYREVQDNPGDGLDAGLDAGAPEGIARSDHERR